MEWLTAEVILHRPIDPLQYARDLLGQKLAERGGTEFRPEVVTDWLRHCYTEATTLVDEHGIIHGKTIEKYTFKQKGKPEVVLLKVINGEHNNPKDIDLFIESWNFFKRQ